MRCSKCEETLVELSECDWCEGTGEDEHGDRCRSCRGAGGEFLCANIECVTNRADARIPASPYTNESLAFDDVEEKEEFLKRAIGLEKYVQFDYVNSKGKPSNRTIRPFAWTVVEHSQARGGGETLCVVGFCYRRNEQRFFAVRRMENLHMVNGPPR